MPELPEVEVTKRGVSQVLVGHTIQDIFMGTKPLRVPLSNELLKLKGAYIEKIERRSKYLILTTTQGYLIIHLGMTGHLQVIETKQPRIKHDHFELMLESGMSVRYNDIRRFGLLLYLAKDQDPYQNKYLKDLGPEPLETSFTPEVLFARIHKRKVPIKQIIMDSKVVVGVGNIYASESLFKAAIDPRRMANTISLEECQVLVAQIKEILEASIQSGGTTIRDFEGADGKPGYFVQKLNVYGHSGEKCPRCGATIERITQGQRATYFCPQCQH